MKEKSKKFTKGVGKKQKGISENAAPVWHVYRRRRADVSHVPLVGTGGALPNLSAERPGLCGIDAKKLLPMIMDVEAVRQ